MGYTTDSAEKPLANLRPAMYSHRLLDIQSAGRSCGYAIAIHGSMQRDMDVVAIPWTEHAGPPEQLISHLTNLGMTMTLEGPAEKPHGRLAYTLLMGGSLFMDLSVMPRTPDHDEQEQPL